MDKEEIMLFDLKRIDLLPACIRELLSDDSRLQRIGDNGYKKAVRNHLWKHRAELLLDMDIPD